MIRRVLVAMLILILFGLIGMWLLSGGAAAIAATARTFANPLNYFFGGDTSGDHLHLPWEPDLSNVRGPDISGYADEAIVRNGSDGSTEYSYSQETPRDDVRSFGNPSTYVNAITFGGGEPTAPSAGSEHLVIHAASSNSQPINLSGWSLQSAVSGLRVYIPGGVRTFVTGVVNNGGFVYLEPGDTAIITTGSSPVGASFKENVCSGYLGELQQFEPELEKQCPQPSESLPRTAENISRYGGSCFDYIDSLENCHFPGNNPPASLAQACRQYVVNTFSYNGCVREYQYLPNFSVPEWRLYLNMRAELWYNTHDVIRLLDDRGRTVDVLTY